MVKVIARCIVGRNNGSSLILVSCVKKNKTRLQYIVGLYIFCVVLLKMYVFIGFPYSSIKSVAIINSILSTKLLVLVSKSMLVSASIELAYMLFTPGPDEAVEPLILGVAGTALLVISDGNDGSLLTDAIVLLLFTIALFLLFYLRFKLKKWFPNEF